MQVFIRSSSAGKCASWFQYGRPIKCDEQVHETENFASDLIKVCNVLHRIESSWIIEYRLHVRSYPASVRALQKLTDVDTGKSGACEQSNSSSPIVSSSSASLTDETLFFLAWGDSSCVSWSSCCSSSLSDCSLRFRAISLPDSNINKNLDFLKYKHCKNLLVLNTDLSGKTNTSLWTNYKLKCKFKTRIKIKHATSKFKMAPKIRSHDHVEHCLMGNVWNAWLKSSVPSS